jgi:putative lipoic acid-binding regulatory protein
METKTDPFKFPSLFSLKVMGKNTNEFYAVVSAIVEKHIGEGDGATYRTRTSSGGRYMSITATFQAQSREQLDAIYLELNASGHVLITL